MSLGETLKGTLDDPCHDLFEDAKALYSSETLYIFYLRMTFPVIRWRSAELEF